MKKKPTLTDKLNNYYRRLQLIAGISLFVVLSALVVILVSLNQKPQEKGQSESGTITPVSENIPFLPDMD
jgi:hypothetical protein